MIKYTAPSSNFDIQVYKLFEGARVVALVAATPDATASIARAP